MHAVIMAGGRGTRINNPGKMMLKINGKTIIENIIKKINNLNIEFGICISEYTPDAVKTMSKNIIAGTGDYFNDLKLAVNYFDVPVIVFSADLIFDIETIKLFIESSFEAKSEIVNMTVKGELSGISIFFKHILNNELRYKNIEINSEGFFNINTVDDYNNALLYYCDFNKQL